MPSLEFYNTSTVVPTRVGILPFRRVWKITSHTNHSLCKKSMGILYLLQVGLEISCISFQANKACGHVATPQGCQQFYFMYSIQFSCGIFSRVFFVVADLQLWKERKRKRSCPLICFSVSSSSQALFISRFGCHPKSLHEVQIKFSCVSYAQGFHWLHFKSQFNKILKCLSLKV